jgi:hypothetical protein
VIWAIRSGYGAAGAQWAQFVGRLHAAGGDPEEAEAAFSKAYD